MEAVRAEVLAVDVDRLRFVHPLLAAAAYAAAPPWERRDAHARLARAAEDRLERAHHLARSVRGAPTRASRRSSTAAAAEAAVRGAPETAARLLERASELTPPEDVETRRRRLAAAVPHHVASGDPGHAGRLLEELVGEHAARAGAGRSPPAARRRHRPR